MPIGVSTSGNIGRRGEGRKLSNPSSPTAFISSNLPSSPIVNPSVPRIKLNLRSHNPPVSPTTSTTSSSTRRNLKPRPTSSASTIRPKSRSPRNQRSSSARGDTGSQSNSQEDDSSDLTPASGSELDEVDLDFDEEQVTPRKGSAKKKTGAMTKSDFVTPTANNKGKGRATPSTVVGKAGTGVGAPSTDKKKRSSGKPANPAKVTPTTSGPGGRERKRAVRMTEVERRRARDDKFGLGGSDRFDGLTSSGARIPDGYISDATSSYGDDDMSDHEGNLQIAIDIGHETDDDVAIGLPEAFAGQEIEDLDYGAGPLDAHMEEEAVAAWWEEEEEDEIFISQLSGSDIEQLPSQSSAGESDSDDCLSDSSSSSASSSGMDQFGFPFPHASLFPPTDVELEEGVTDPPLILMENWDGQFVLVQPRQERSRSRHRSDKGSRTNGSVSGSTVLSSGEQQALLVDPEAVDGEFEDDDDDNSTDWSAEGSDDDGGDTTDSMAEEDMPMLNSAALEGLIVGLGGDEMMGGIGVGHGLDVDPQNVLGPAIIVTESSVLDTPALSTSTSASSVSNVQTDIPKLANSSSNLPATPNPVTNLNPPAVPVMGTFLPVIDDHASHAVIDGSKSTTKSPFIRRRRPSKPATDSGSIISSSSRPRLKRKITSSDPFSLTASHSPNPSQFTVPKKARYSSIPGHPRYIAAQAALIETMDRETTPTDSESNGGGRGDDVAISLEDMLDAEMLGNHLSDYEGATSPGTGAGGEDHLRHLIRFDRVPVSTYLRRNYLSSGGIGRGETLALTGHQQHYYSSPSRGYGHGHGHGYGHGHGHGHGLEHRSTLLDTLAGPPSHMLISPILAPIGSDDIGGSSPARNRLSRKEKRKAKRSGSGGEGLSGGMRPLQI